ncbi:Helix-turn-helix domain-containing protein [Frankineae bacterium MT45]|nr:Helix-turn-helix domain-containing protein [Frankineae bacterium MT45]
MQLDMSKEIHHSCHMSKTQTMTIGQKVRSRREALDISRERLAARAEMSVSTVIRLERDDQVPNVRYLARLAEILDMPVAELLSAVAAS